METFEQLVERYMQCDKKTLAELLALKELYWYPKTQDPPPTTIQPWTTPYYPRIGDFPPYYTWITTTSTTDNNLKS